MTNDLIGNFSQEDNEELSQNFSTNSPTSGCRSPKSQYMGKDKFQSSTSPSHSKSIKKHQAQVDDKLYREFKDR